jgi:2-polyprenyl-6-methoxyphenol hydroxylase-like FAD-dependent oxidoreductase
MSQKFLVAGGGLGGIAAALALHRAGFAATVFERAPAFGEVGAGLSLWPNATRVLESWGVLDAVLQRGRPVTQFNLHRSDGRLISVIAMTGFRTPALCIHRADLHRVLRDGLPPAAMETHQTLASFEVAGLGVRARFADGQEREADGLIGADGVKSVVRTQLHGAQDPIYRGYCIWRGIAPESAGMAGGHISETWGRGRRFGILPMGRGRICWYATSNGPAAVADAPEGRKAEVQGLFRDWHDPIASLIAATDPRDILKANAYDRRPLQHWGAGPVTLLGDAAHPITPNVGQGACMAIEDAAGLAKALRQERDVPAAFRAYEAVRRPRRAFIARRARQIGAIGQWEHPWVVRARDFATRLVLSRSADMQLNAMYAYEA